ncbi:MAG: cupin domain-containing protein [Lapillicoccus sp.]
MKRRWHQVRSAELWFHHRGSALELSLGGGGAHPANVTRHRLGPDIVNGEAPQLLVPPGHWQAARQLGDEPLLVSCVVVPGFDFADFALLDPAKPRRLGVASARDGRGAEGGSQQ